MTSFRVQSIGKSLVINSTVQFCLVQTQSSVVPFGGKWGGDLSHKKVVFQVVEHRDLWKAFTDGRWKELVVWMSW